MASTQGQRTKRPERAGPAGPRGIVRLIAIFKFCKAALLVAVGFGALGLLRPSAAQRAYEWAASLAMSSPAVQHLVALASGLTPGRLEALGIAAILFAGLFTTEGVGLWLGKRWAEYLTVIATLSFVPLELFELTRRASWPRLAALALNLAVTVYLTYRLRRRR